MQNRQSMLSLGTGIQDYNRATSPYQDYPAAHPSMSNLRGQSNTPPSVAGFGASRAEIEAKAAQGYNAVVEELLNPEAQSPIDDDIMI